MLDFIHVPEFWLGGMVGLIAGMFLMAALFFLLEDAEHRRDASRQLPPRSGKGYRWPAANDPTGPIERSRSARSELRSRPR
ncbi:MAG: hypothetical protein GX761_03035 [Gammaproteobacteria bacterium]|nr:hypothetical protein [Gammaproteobacteria bacterium]